MKAHGLDESEGVGIWGLGGRRKCMKLISSKVIAAVVRGNEVADVDGRNTDCVVN